MNTEEQIAAYTIAIEEFYNIARACEKLAEAVDGIAWKS